MKLCDLSLDRPVATVMLLVCLMVLGTVAIFQLPLDFMPLVKEPEVDIEVPFPGSHPLEAMRQAVLPIEEEIATIPDIKSIRSNSHSGSANIEVQFDWDANIDLKKMEVREAVERARPRLPATIGHIRVEGDIGGPGEGSILQGRISADRDLSESWELLDRRIRRPLERIKGVARVSLYGVEAQQVRIDLDLDALRRHGVRPGELLARIDAANLDLDLGAVRGDVLRYGVRSVGRFRDLATIQDLLLDPTSGLRVRDVARVALEEPRLDYGRHLDRKFAIGIDVFKEPTANTVDTVDRLMVRIREIESDPELRGIQLLVWLNQGEEIRASLGGLRDSGILGGILAAGVLYLFLRRVSTTAVVSVAIPFSLVVTCGAMYLLGAGFNVLTLLGLMFGVGMLVDNAIVVVENIHRLEGLGIAPRVAAREGARQVSLAVTASTATTIIVWSWLFVSPKSGLTIYMGQVALTICLSVACSLLVSLTFVPLAASRFAPRREVEPGFVLRRVVPAYRALLGWTLRHRAATLFGLLLLGGSAAVPIALIEKSGEPKFQQRSVAIQYQIHDPATKEVLEGYVDQVETWLTARRSELGYENTYSWYSENQGCMTQVYLPRGEASEDGIARLRRQLQSGLPEIAGVKLEVGGRDWWRSGNEGRRMVAVALHGEDPEYLEQLALDVEERLRDTPGAVEVYGPGVQGQKEVRVQVDPERARMAGVSPDTVANAVGFAFRGQRLRRFEGPRGEIEVLLGLPEDVRPGLATLADLQVPTERGPTIALETVAHVEIARTAPQIRREDRRTTTWVSVQFDEKAVTTEEAQSRVAARLTGLALPAGYNWDWGQWGRDRDEGLGTMLQGVLLSLIVVVLLMAALFESALQPIAILITLPLAFFGAFWSLWIFGYDLDAVGFMGVIILIGIVVNNGIVLVDHVNGLRREGRERTAALIEGCGDRMRPVLMTAITTIFGLLPMAFSTFTVAGAYVDSLAVGVLGGLTTSTIFTLIALPAWYATVEDAGAFFTRLVPRRVPGEAVGAP